MILEAPRSYAVLGYLTCSSWRFPDGTNCFYVKLTECPRLHTAAVLDASDYCGGIVAVCVTPVHGRAGAFDVIVADRAGTLIVFVATFTSC